MRTEKTLGVVFLAVAIGDLLRKDWLGLTLLGVIGAGLLLAPRRLKLPFAVEIGLAIVLFALIITRIVWRLSS